MNKIFIFLKTNPGIFCWHMIVTMIGIWFVAGWIMPHARGQFMMIASIILAILEALCWMLKIGGYSPERASSHIE